MKSIITKSLALVFLVILSFSCTKDTGENYIENYTEKGSDIDLKGDSPKSPYSYSLLYQKEVFEFDSKRDLYSFLAKKDKSTAIFLAEVIVSDLNKEYIEKYGEKYMIDQSIWKNFEKDLEDEFEIDELSSSYQCVICTTFPDLCIDSIITHWFFSEYFKLTVYDDAQYTGENYLFDDSKTILITEYDSCEGMFGSVELPNLATRGQIWDNKISSFQLEAILWHESAVLTLYSETNLTGSEFVYHMSAQDTKVWESDLSDNYWRIRNLPFDLDNKVSSLGIKFHRSPYTYN